MKRKRLTKDRKLFLKIKKEIGRGFADKINKINPEISVGIIYWVFLGKCRNAEIIQKVLTSAREAAALEIKKKKENVALIETILKKD